MEPAGHHGRKKQGGDPAPKGRQETARYSRSRRSVSAPLNHIVFIPAAAADAAFSARSSIKRMRCAGLPITSSARRYISGFGLRSPTKHELSATSKYSRSPNV